MKRGADSDCGGNRSEAGKSELTVLAEKFKEQFCREADVAKDVNLNSVADNLQVSRRRLYDIVNVLEALQMVSRSGKLTYRWEGIAHLPRLLAMLYSDALAGAERGQSNPAILEGRMPGSCWALTRRIVQQLLIDRSQVPLTLLVQRLESALTPSPGDTATAAAAAASSGGKTSLATVERRIYDIGSVLSTFDLVSKTLQGGSGPRHRQPVYQWLLDWESQLPAETLQAVYQEAANAAATATAAAAATAAPESMPIPEDGRAAATAARQDTRLQQHQSYQLPPTSVSAAPQQQQLAPSALNNQQQPQGHDQHALGLQQPALSTAATALQHRLQQLNQLVTSVLAQHGEKTCVKMSQLKDLLQQVQAGEPPQQELAAANSIRQQQLHPSDPTDSSSKDTYHEHQEHDDQEQLDAAECLQQLRAGGASAQQPGAKQQNRDDQQQQQCSGGQAHEDVSRVSEQRCHKKQRRCCLSDAPESSDQCCLGMTCLDLGAALRAAVSNVGQQGQLQTASQQEPQLLLSAAGAAQDAVLCGSLPGGPSNDAVDEEAPDYAAFAAVEGDEAPGARVGSNTLNNSREGVSFQELAAAAVASLQQHRQQDQQQESPQVIAASDPHKEGPGKHCCRSSAAAAGGVHQQLAPQHHRQQQLELQAEEPWLHTNADQPAAVAGKGACPSQPEDGLQWLLPLLQAVQGPQAEQTTQLLTQVRLGSSAAAESQVQHPQHDLWWPALNQQQQQHGAAGEHLELSVLLHAMSVLQPACVVPQQQQQGQAHNQHSQQLLMSTHLDSCDRGSSKSFNSAAGSVHADAAKHLDSHGAVQSSAAGDEQDWLFSLLRQHHVGAAAAPAVAAEALLGGAAPALVPAVLALGGHTLEQLHPCGRS